MENNELDLTNDNLLGDEFSNAGGLKRFISKQKEKRHEVKEKIKGRVEKRKEKFKKRIKKLKEKVGKIGKRFRNRFRAILRKGILRNIKHNVHGMATRLYPAIAPASEIKNRKYKSAFATKSKAIYSDLLAKWLKMGGSEADLKNAITEGSKRRFLKLKGKSFEGNNSDDFYGYITPDVNIYYGDDGSETTEESGAVNEAEGTEEMPDQEETKKGMKGFFAWLKGLFHKHGADENPYEASTPEASTFQTDVKEDAGNEPDASEANNDVMTELDSTTSADDTGGATDTEKGAETKSAEEGGVTADEEGADDKILGIPSTVFYVGVGVLALVGGYLIYRKMNK